MLSRYSSISSVLPERLTTIESWHRHIPFAFAMLDMLQPKVFVELGTHRGDSYSAFCQGVVQQKLDTRCYAVDTWQGDAHAGEYGDEIHDELRAWHDPRYASFSSLLRMTFDQALEHFPDGSVDLLHIDGLHTYDAVKHDFESWLPKLSERAVVLFHDTNVRYDDFAVWQLWAELEQQYPAFEFPYGFGLGVLAVGKKVPAAVLDFLQYATANSQEVVSCFYRYGDAAEARKKQAEIERLDRRLQDVGSQLEHARLVVDQRDQALQQAGQGREQAAQEWQRQRQATAQQVEQLQQQILSLREQVFELQEEGVQLLRVQANHRRLLRGQEYQLKNVLGSRPWRMRNRCLSLLGLGQHRVEFAPLDLLPMAHEQVQRLEQARPGVTIIVPVYKGIQDTIDCIESILASQYALTAELVVINDASPEPELVSWLEDNAGRFTLLHNEKNLGFVATVNRGMALYPQQDVVLVNSDTEVANDWLDRLQKVAYSAADVGSVTPFSNNATICSYPLFCQDNELPTGMDVARMDRVFAGANAGQTVDIPTAVGFCMYIRRDCLQDVGLFDALRFGRGYGEENEFCMRSALHGWRHLLAGEVFVYHKGGVSFAETQSEHQRYGHAALTKLFPDYDWVIQQHVAADPAARLRFAAGVALARESGLPVVLMINHGRGGGSQRHLQELADNLLGQAIVYSLQTEGPLLRLQPMADAGQQAALRFCPEQDGELLLLTLRQLGVTHLHYHHVIDLPQAVLQLPEELACSYDITVHDFYLACPQVTLADAQGAYCGAPPAAGCNACLTQRPVAGVESIEQWRALHEQMLGGAERVFVPSRDTLQRIAGYFPAVGNWVWAAHEPEQWPAVSPSVLDVNEPLRVLVLGALSAFKGADVLEAVTLQARARRLPMEFHLLGYGYRRLRSHPVSALHVHGAYQEEQAQALIADIKPHLVWFPGNCPETWSYTLSTALAAGLPVLATRIGAFPERLAGREWSWLAPVNSSTDDWLECLQQVRQAMVQQQAPQVPVKEIERRQGFIYQQGYMAGLEVQGPQNDASATWASLHAGWLQAAREPQIVLLPQVRNPYVRRLLVSMLRRGWLQPVLARIPSTLMRRLKKLLTV